MAHVIDALLQNVERYSSKRALRTTEGEDVTWKGYGTLVRVFANALLARGTQKGDRVMIMASNSVEWFVSYLGTISVGAIPVGIYCTNTKEMCTVIFDNCTPSLIVCDVDVISSVAHLDADKVVIVKTNRPNFDVNMLEAHMAMQSTTEGDVQRVSSPRETSSDAQRGAGMIPAMLFRAFMDSGTIMDHQSVYAERLRAIRETDVCSIIYTSGTTGDPKGCMLTHRNFTWTSESVLRTFPYLGRKERVVSYLPLSHVAAQLLDIHCCTRLGSVVHFTNANALRNGTLVSVLKRVQPTVFLAVPRVWEKVCEGMGAKLNKQNAVSREIATWALQRGKERMAGVQYEGTLGGERDAGGVAAKGSGGSVANDAAAGDERGGGGIDSEGSDMEDTGDADDVMMVRKPATPSCEHAIAKAMVLNKIRHHLGLQKAKLCFSGAAPLGKDSFELLGSMGVYVYDIYGQTETTGPHSVNAPSFWKVGSSGLPLAGSETSICEETGEILVRGAHVAKGYWGKEEEPFVDTHGWFHTGDTGRIDRDGFLHITGRIKELLITSGGENVSPVAIEQRIKLYTGVEHAVVVGDRRKFLTALLFGEVEEGVDVDVAMAKVNEGADTRVHTIKKWTILPDTLSVEGGELTPTMKLKRNMILERFRGAVDGMYDTT